MSNTPKKMLTPLFSRTIVFVLTLIFSVGFSAAISIYAAPPTSQYVPGETLDPVGCGPGDPNCTVSVEPALTTFTTVSAATYTVLSTDQVIYANSASNDITITLPSIATAPTAKRMIVVVKTSANNSVFVDAAASDYINYASSVSLNTIRQSVTIESVSAHQWLGTLNFAELDVTPIVVEVASSNANNFTNLQLTYNNGSSGIGATLTHKNPNTLVNINGALTLDGITGFNIGDRVLIKSENTTITRKYNGVYEVTDPGSASTPWILTRTTDSDEDTDLHPQIVIPSRGSSANKGRLWSQNALSPIVVGTTLITYSSISPATGSGSTGDVTQQTSGTQVSGQIPFWTSGSKELSTGTSNLFWDETNSRLTTGTGTSGVNGTNGEDFTVVAGNGGAGSGSDGAGGGITLRTGNHGNSAGDAWGGDFNLLTGSGALSGGGIYLSTGAGAAGTGGNIVLQTGIGIGGQGGGFSLTTGGGTSEGGDIALSAGAGGDMDFTTNSGDFTFTTGGITGGIGFTSGVSGISFFSGKGGPVTIGVGTPASGNGGSVQINAGQAGAGGTDGNIILANTFGRVGIGQSSLQPRSLLAVKESADNFTGGITLQRSTTNDTWSLVNGMSNILYFGYADNASGADAAGDFNVQAMLTSDGKFGVGVSPSYPLHVKGDVGGIVQKWETANGTQNCTIDPAAGAGALSCTSDQSLKSNIAPIGPTLAKILKLEPVSYNWNPSAGAPRSFGFIAQEVQKVIPEVVSYDQETGKESLSTVGLIPYLVQGFKELNAKVDAVIAGRSPTLTTAPMASIENQIKIFFRYSKKLFIRGETHLDEAFVGASDRRTGITLFDIQTGQPFCLNVTNGHTNVVAGECEVLVRRSSSNNATASATPPQCDDDIDNDFDGLTDWEEDYGCDTLEDDDETDVIPPPACSDGLDNDNDSYIDMYDPGCNDVDDDNEINGSIQSPVECNDGLDNDGDTFIDQLDPQCTNAFDGDESS